MSASREIESQAIRSFGFIKDRIDARFKKIDLPGKEAITALNARIAALRGDSGRQQGS